MDKKQKIILVVLLVIVTNLFTFGATKFVLGNVMITRQLPEIFSNEKSPGEFDSLKEVFNVIVQDYYEEVEQEKLIEGALEGMLEKLDDPQTNYMTPAERENLMIETEGSYGGIGIEVFQEDDYVRVVAPISGTPGDKAGLQSGDKITEVDGQDVIGLDLNEVVEMIRGEEGTEVKLSIKRKTPAGESEEHSFVVERQEIEMVSVEHEIVEEKFGYVEINSFTQQTPGEFETALKDLDQAGIEGLVIDVRGNPGGLLDAAIEVGEFIVPEGPIVHQMGREEKINTYYSDGSEFDLPMVILVDEGSASASEILAGALQDTSTATIVGNETFGKASVQNVIPLSDGGALRYTMGSYQTPDKRDLHEKGLTPDVEIERHESYYLGEYPIADELAPGDEDDMVKTLQNILDILGYYQGETDGSFDEKTENAVKKFQRESGMEADGVVTDYVVMQLREELQEYQQEHDDTYEEGLEILRGKVEG